MAANGNTLLIYKGNTLIAGTKSNEIKTLCDLMETSTSSIWREYISGRKSWSVTVGYLVTSTISAASNLLTVGNSYTISIRTRTGTSVASGTAICSECTIRATKGSLMQGTFTFRGSGPLST